MVHQLWSTAGCSPHGFVSQMELVKIEHLLVPCSSIRLAKPSVYLATICPASFKHLFYGESNTPIYETELLPVLISVLVWGELIKGSQVVFYLDNESAKSGLIKGYGATKVANAIVGSFCQTEALLQLKTWFSRVPTHSNPSDGPSRMCFGLANSLGWHQAFGAMVKGQRTHLVTPGQTWGYGGACVIFPHLLWKKECFRKLVFWELMFVT